MDKKVEYSFYKLDVWKLGMNIVNEIYSITKNFPNDEKFCLVAQIRRSAISIPLNIAEGSAKRTKKDFANFVRISLGSLMETMTCVEISFEQKYINKAIYDKLHKMIQEEYFKLVALDKFLIRQ